MTLPRARVVDVKTGRTTEAEILTAPEARELRRRMRRAAESQKELGLRILSAATRQASRGRVGAARRTIMHGFGQIVVNAALSKLRSLGKKD